MRAATLNLPAGLKSKADNAIRCLGVAVDRQTFTILGASGFIGRALVAWLESGDHVVHAVTRASLPALLASRRPAGHVIDCVGISNDCRLCPLDTAEAHVGLVAHCLTELKFESFLLLSSTRVYAHAGATHEDATLSALPSDPADLYNLTKLAGEALCLADPRFSVRVARLSDVYGMDMPAATSWVECCTKVTRPAGRCFTKAPHLPGTMSASLRSHDCCLRSRAPGDIVSTISQPAQRPNMPTSLFDCAILPVGKSRLRSTHRLCATRRSTQPASTTSSAPPAAAFWPTYRRCSLLDTKPNAHHR